MKADIQDERYMSAAAEFGRALERLARGYEAHPNLRSDLLQEIHLAPWRSLAGFDERCSMGTWVYLTPEALCRIIIYFGGIYLYPLTIVGGSASSSLKRTRRWGALGRCTRLSFLKNCPA